MNGASADLSVDIQVSEPHKIRDGYLSSVAYTIKSRLNSPAESSSADSGSYSVTRQYSDILKLFEYLCSTYNKEGIIIPPLPPKASLRASATVAAVSNNEELQASTASKVIGSVCKSLDRYFKRLAKHPVVINDPVFRAFIREKKVPTSLLELPSSLGQKLREKMSDLKSRYMAKEDDPWFMTKQLQLDELRKQLKSIRDTLSNMTKLKMKLYQASHQFRHDLVLLLVSRPLKDNHLGNIINGVVDCQRVMGSIYDRQSDADRLIVALAADYEQIVKAAMKVMLKRRTLNMHLQKAKKDSSRIANSAKENDVTDLPDMDKQYEELNESYDLMSKTLKRELQHLDSTMKEEFEAAFAAYSASYWRSLQEESAKELGPVSLTSNTDIYPNIDITSSNYI